MNFNKKIEIRITETEKEIVDALRNKNINISEEIRDFILSLDINISRKLLKNEYKKNNDRISEIEIQLRKLKGDYEILKKKNLNPKELDIKNLINIKIKNLST